uniref:Uncharacterized protein n=1 Tax=Sphaerodactylus townsendi TaxID=933632 RepID=A0ACB8FQ83_9SAUR
MRLECGKRKAGRLAQASRGPAEPLWSREAAVPEPLASAPGRLPTHDGLAFYFSLTQSNGAPAASFLARSCRGRRRCRFSQGSASGGARGRSEARRQSSLSMERSEAYFFSIALSCAFLGSCLLFSVLNRQQRAPYMDEAFHVPQAQAYCEGRFQQVGRRAAPASSCRLKGARCVVVSPPPHAVTWPRGPRKEERPAPDVLGTAIYYICFFAGYTRERLLLGSRESSPL